LLYAGSSPLRSAIKRPIISSNMTTSNLSTLGMFLLSLALVLTYIILAPLRRLQEPRVINKPGKVPVTPYVLASFAMMWAIFLASALEWLISRAGSSVYWITVVIYLIIAFIVYGLFHLGLVGRMFSLILCGVAALISVILYNGNNHNLTAAGAGTWFLLFAILSIYLFRHRRDYAALWKSGKIDSLKPAIMSVLAVYYIIVFTVKFLK
jgi:hypothetical protein